MIISKLNALFFHIPKTAGQSIEQAILSDLDIPWDERRTHPQLLMHLSDNPTLPNSLVHLTPKQYLSHGFISEPQFDSMFKFAFVRNPWARLVSSYHYLGIDAVWTFKDFLFKHLHELDSRTAALHLLPQSDFVEDESGKLCTDFIGYFETLNEDFEEVATILSLKSKTLPFRNKSPRPKREPSILTSLKHIIKLQRYRLKIQRNTRDHYTKYYDGESLELTRKLFIRDIDNFGYTFDGLEKTPINVGRR